MPPSAPSPSPRQRRVGFAGRVFACAIGLALLGAAIWGVSRDPQVTARLWHDLPGWPWWAGVLLFAFPCVNWLLTGAVFFTLTKARARVSWLEMTALVGAGWVLNFFPLSPGLFARVAYQRSRHGLSLRTSTRIIIESIALGCISVGLVLPALLLAVRSSRGPWAPGLWASLCVLLAILALGACGRWPGTARELGTMYCRALALKAADLLVWTARYALVFHLAGTPISWPAALGVALVAQMAMLVPLIGNGLGIREWAVGLLVGVLPAVSTASGLGADLLNRAGELGAAIPVGLGCAAWLAHHHHTRPDPARGPSPIKTLPEPASQADP